MNLSFSTQINGEPTFFMDKIWSGIHENHLSSNSEGIFYSELGKKFDSYSTLSPKIHTIREDKKDRWKVGNDIHFVINNRTKKRFQFAPVLKVKSVQKIGIIWDNPCVSDFNSSSCITFLYKNRVRYVTVFVDSKRLGFPQVSKLAQNDGFNSIDDFFKYFNSDFQGKLIHWTDFKY